jgi:8-oxo-dGTP diphosphatase
MIIVGCFLEFEGKFLILLRHSHKPNGNTWGLPAGKVEPGEKNADAMVRELYEETGYKTTVGELEHLGDFTFGDKDKAYTFATYRLKTSELPNVQQEEAAHAQFRWVTPEECFSYPDLISDFHDLLKITGYIK